MKLWILLPVVFSCWDHTNGQQRYDVTIETEKPICTLNERFLSVAIDFGVVRRGLKYNLQDPKLITLTRGLAPGFIRLGGTAEDFMTFIPHGAERYDALRFANNTLNDDVDVGKDDTTPFNMTGKQLEDILRFNLVTNMDLFIGLNVLRRAHGTWDPTNAQVIMNFIQDRGVLVHWQLGNEPPFGKFNVTLNPDQLALDFERLFTLKNRHAFFRNSYLVGPDIGQFRGKSYKMDFYDRFIRHAVPVLNAVTWHMYYLNGRTATLNDFINATILDTLAAEIDTFTKVTRNYSPSLPIWLGETSSAYGGGAEGLSDRYVAGFMWLDKLGLAARKGIELVIRQSLFDGHYCLLYGKDFEPRPDYWLSLLYKKLVGFRVLDVEVKSTSNNVRIYAHCTNDKATLYPKGSIVLYALNLLEQEVELNVNLTTVTVPVDEFVLTPANNDLKSENVLLNGRKLVMPDRETLPDLSPKSADGIRLPPLSFGFFVMKDFVANACLQK